MHFLGKRGGGGTNLASERAAVQVKVGNRKKLIIVPGSIFIAKAGVRIVRLPADVQVEGDEEVIAPSPGKSFWVTTETIDPFHAVLEM